MTNDMRTAALREALGIDDLAERVEALEQDRHDEWFTPDQACEYLQIGREALRNRVRAGSISAHGDTRKMVRYRKSDLDKLMTGS